MRKEQELATTASSKGRQLNGYSFQGNNPIEDIDLRQQHCLGRRFHILVGVLTKLFFNLFNLYKDFDK